MYFQKTLNYKEYLYYRDIKEDFHFEYKGVNVTAGAAFTLLNFIVFNKKAKIQDLYFSVLKLFLKIDKERIYNACKKNRIIITELCDRPEHLDLLKKIQQELNDSIILPLNPHKKGLYINLSNLRKILLYTFSAHKLKNIPFKGRLLIALELAYYCNQVDVLEEIFKKDNIATCKYIPLNSATGIEAIITLYMNKLGLETYHIFHGIFGRYKLSIANDVINGENITAQKVLAFSESTKEDLNRDFHIASENIIIAGNPKYIFRKISVKNEFKKCIVLNGFRYYDSDFVQLLVLLNSISVITGIEFHVKPHPSSQILSFPGIEKLTKINFIEKRITIKELFNQGSYDFAVTFNTVTYYECMYNDLVCLRYSVNENIDFTGLEDRFADQDSFIERVNYFKELNPHDLNQQITELLINTFGMGINKYKEIIED